MGVHTSRRTCDRERYGRYTQVKEHVTDRERYGGYTQVEEHVTDRERYVEVLTSRRTRDTERGMQGY